MKLEDNEGGKDRMSKIVIPDMRELARFLVKAKKNAWAGDKGKVKPQRPGFKEFVFVDGDWEYRDSYIAFYCAPGQEIVRLRGQGVWSMGYDGGMAERHWGDRDFAKQTFDFLKRALLMVEELRPFRGPSRLREESWLYINDAQGGIERFTGRERIFHDSEEVFCQNYIGGLIVSK